MAPQPMKFVISDRSSALFTSDAMDQRPTVAVKIAKCIAIWSEIESYLASVLARMLGAHAEIATDIYAAINSRPAQIRILNIASEWTLEDDSLLLFQAILSIIDKAKPAA
jgi:hypothetical protein